MEEEGFSNIKAEVIYENFVMITRHNPKIQKHVILLAHTCFRKKSLQPITHFSVNLSQHKVSKILLSARIKIWDEKLEDNNLYISGPKHQVELSEGSFLPGMCDIEEGHINIRFFPPGSILIMESEPNNEAYDALTDLEDLDHDLNIAMMDLDLLCLNILLYRCDPEEFDLQRKHI